MIRPFSVALIYGGGRSYEYAKRMKDVISEGINNCLIIPQLVDGGNGNVWEYITGLFSEVEYAIVFLSQAYEGTKVNNILKGEKEERKVTMSTPNLMLEFGYMLHKLGKDNIKIVADFDYNLIKKDMFLFPSDMAGMFVDAEAELVYNDRIKAVMQKIWEDIKCDLYRRNEIDKIVNVNELLTRSYKPNIKRVFAKEMKEDINSYSLDKQYMKVWNGWLNELKEIDRLREEDSKVDAAGKYKIAYLFERILLLFIYDKYGREDESRIDVEYLGFSDKDIGVDDVYIRLYRTIFKYIFESGEYGMVDYLDNAEIIIKCLKGMDEESYFGILAKNYAGLCLLNAYIKGADTQPELLEQSMKYFRDVIRQSSEYSVQSSLDEKILCAYAKYNLARAMVRAGEDYSEYSKMYKQCIKDRNELSKCSELPDFVRIYWLREAYHAENSRIFEASNYWHENKMVEEIEEAKEKLKEIGIHLKSLETTRVAKQPFFERIKLNVEMNYKRLVGEESEK